MPADRGAPHSTIVKAAKGAGWPIGRDKLVQHKAVADLLAGRVRGAVGQDVDVGVVVLPTFFEHLVVMLVLKNGEE
jgi:hypothetical protein